MREVSAKIALAAGGFATWWLGEVKTILPTGWRLPFASANHAEIRPGRCSTLIVRARGNIVEELLEPLPTSSFTESNWQEVVDLTRGYRTSIILAPPLVHTLSLKLPNAARSRLPAAVAIQLRDHSPVDPAAISWGIGNIERDEEGLKIATVIAHQTTLDALAAGYGNISDEVPPILAEQGQRHVLLRAAKRPALHISREQMPWLLGVAILALTPLLGLGLLTYQIGASEARVTDLQESAAPVLQGERSLRERAQAAHALQSVISTPDALVEINTLAANLPEGAKLTQIDHEADGSLSFELIAPDPDLVRHIFGKLTTLPGLHPLNEFKGPDGAAHLRFTTSTR